MNTIFQSKHIHRFKWYSPSGYLKRIDYFLVDNFLRQCSTNCRAYRGASKEFESDHRMVVLNMRCAARSERKTFFQKRPQKPRPAINMLKSQQVQTSYSQQLEDELANINQPDDPNDYEKIIVDAIDNATNAACPIIVPADLPAPWSNTEFQQLLESRRKCKDMKEKKT